MDVMVTMTTMLCVSLYVDAKKNLNSALNKTGNPCKEGSNSFRTGRLEPKVLSRTGGVPLKSLLVMETEGGAGTNTTSIQTESLYMCRAGCGHSFR